MPTSLTSLALATENVGRFCFEEEPNIRDAVGNLSEIF